MISIFDAIRIKIADKILGKRLWKLIFKWVERFPDHPNETLAQFLTGDQSIKS